MALWEHLKVLENTASSTHAHVIGKDWQLDFLDDNLTNIYLG